MAQFIYMFLWKNVPILSLGLAEKRKPEYKPRYKLFNILTYKISNASFQVSIDFVEEQKKPGEKTKMAITAKPGSRVAISALDKSVLLLKHSGEVSKGEVSEVMFIGICKS